MSRSAKVHADAGALLAFVYFYNAAFKPLERAFYNHNTVIIIKAY